MVTACSSWLKEHLLYVSWDFLLWHVVTIFDHFASWTSYVFRPRVAVSASLSLSREFSIVKTITPVPRGLYADSAHLLLRCHWKRGEVVLEQTVVQAWDLWVCFPPPRPPKCSPPWMLLPPPMCYPPHTCMLPVTPLWPVPTPSRSARWWWQRSTLAFGAKSPVPCFSMLFVAGVSCAILCRAFKVLGKTTLSKIVSLPPASPL